MRSQLIAALRLGWVALGVWGLAPLPASGSLLWANVGTPLHPIDVATGAAGPAVVLTGGSLSGYSDLAGESVSQGGLVWGVSGFGVDHRLSSLDPAAGQVVASAVITAPERLVSLAIDPITSVFYGASATSLYRLSPTSGVATLVGVTALDVDKALGFDQLGNLYGIANQNQLVAVDKATGATSLVATLGVFRMEDIAVRPETGVMYGIGYGPGYSLYEINLANGSLNNLGPSLTRPNGLAFAAVPEPTAGVSVIVAMLGLAVRRRSCCC